MGLNAGGKAMGLRLRSYSAFFGDILSISSTMHFGVYGSQGSKGSMRIHGSQINLVTISMEKALIVGVLPQPHLCSLLYTPLHGAPNPMNGFPGVHSRGPC